MIKFAYLSYVKQTQVCVCEFVCQHVFVYIIVPPVYCGQFLLLSGHKKPEVVTFFFLFSL